MDTQPAKFTAHKSQQKPWHMAQNQVAASKSHQKHDFIWKPSGAVEGFPWMAFSASLYSDCRQILHNIKNQKDQEQLLHSARMKKKPEQVERKQSIGICSPWESQILKELF